MSNKTSLRARKGQFINRRTGQPVRAGTPYHIHPDKGPMEGAKHNPRIKGGTKGHDYFDKITYTKQRQPNGRTDDTIILGCTDPDANNYNPNATWNDGSCTYYQDLPDDGSDLIPIIQGCTDQNAANYNSEATVDDGTCIYDIPSDLPYLPDIVPLPGAHCSTKNFDNWPGAILWDTSEPWNPNPSHWGSLGIPAMAACRKHCNASQITYIPQKVTWNHPWDGWTFGDHDKLCQVPAGNNDWVDDGSYVTDSSGRKLTCEDFTDRWESGLNECGVIKWVGHNNVGGSKYHNVYDFGPWYNVTEDIVGHQNNQGINGPFGGMCDCSTQNVSSERQSSRQMDENRILDCSEEERFIQEISRLSPEKMLLQLRNYLKNNKPCLNNQPEPYSSVSIPCGDINKDGFIDVQDLIPIISYILGHGNLSEDQLCLADINGDGYVDLLDLVTIANSILNGTPLNTCSTSSYCEGLLHNFENNETINCPEGQMWNGYECAPILQNTQKDTLGDLRNFSVMSINVGKFGYMPLDQIHHAGEYPFCSGCATGQLCNRTDEGLIADEIESKSPDILVMTELLPQYFCSFSSCDYARENDPNSSCYDDGTTQIERLLRGNYQYTCNEFTPNDGVDGAGFTCTAIKNGITITEEAVTLPKPMECDGVSKANHETVSYSYIDMEGARLKVIQAHPINALMLEHDACRRGYYKQVFEELYNPYENIVIAGDFNNDAYRFNWKKIWDWNIPDAKQWVGDFIKYNLNNDFPHFSYRKTEINGCTWVAGNPNITYELDTTYIDIDYVNIDLLGCNDSTGTCEEITDPLGSNNNDYFKLTINIRFDDFDFIAGFSGNDWFGLCSFSPAVESWGNVVMEITMLDEETTTGHIDFSGLSWNIINWPNWLGESYIRNKVIGHLNNMGENVETLGSFLRFIPLDYNAIRNNMRLDESFMNSIQNDTSEYWHEQITPISNGGSGAKGFIPHNAQNAFDNWHYDNSGYNDASLFGSDNLPPPTHDLTVMKQTIDYIITNFASTSNCEITTFPNYIMDHKAVYCELETELMPEFNDPCSTFENTEVGGGSGTCTCTCQMGGGPPPLPQMYFEILTSNSCGGSPMMTGCSQSNGASCSCSCSTCFNYLCPPNYQCCPNSAAPEGYDGFCIGECGQPCPFN